MLLIQTVSIIKNWLFQLFNLSFLESYLGCNPTKSAGYDSHNDPVRSVSGFSPCEDSELHPSECWQLQHLVTRFSRSLATSCSCGWVELSEWWPLWVLSMGTPLPVSLCPDPDLLYYTFLRPDSPIKTLFDTDVCIPAKRQYYFLTAVASPAQWLSPISIRSTVTLLDTYRYSFAYIRPLNQLSGLIVWTHIRPCPRKRPPKAVTHVRRRPQRRRWRRWRRWWGSRPLWRRVLWRFQTCKACVHLTRDSFKARAVWSGGGAFVCMLPDDFGRGH